MDANVTHLADVPYGRRVKVLDLLHEEEVRTRLLELGIVPGAEVMLVRSAPFGCPVEVDVAGSRFSMRRDVLGSILIQPRA